MEGRKLPVGVQSFEDLRNNKYLYVDKTEYVWKLINTGKTYFLSRPRRFGKSLLTSTIAAYFEGKKDLFKGLAIEKYENEKGDKAWQSYPVIYFSLSGGSYTEEGGLSDQLDDTLENTIKNYGLSESETTGKTLPVKFKNVIKGLYEKTGRQVVVLVDEYDKPLLDNIQINEELEEKNRELYSGFFSILKDTDQYIKLSFITGVTKFAKVSIFSGMNQPEDISLTDEYACICGITEEEMLLNFQPEIERLCRKKKLTKEECLRKLADTYDGYHFSAEGAGVYNPFSLLNALKQMGFSRYWFSTGTPSFLISKLKHSNKTLEQFADGVRATEDTLRNYRDDSFDPIPLFYQSGYLTICGWHEEYHVYDLKFPNNEVEYGFMNSLAETIVPADQNKNGLFVMDFVEDLHAGKIDSFIKRLEALFASVPYSELSKEHYESEWRNEIFLFLKLLGENVKCEVHTAEGRADCIVETKDYVYIFEFKVDKSAEEALDQIDEKGYALPYLADSRKIIKVGVDFSSEKRNIENHLVA